MSLLRALLLADPKALDPASLGNYSDIPDRWPSLAATTAVAAMTAPTTTAAATMATSIPNACMYGDESTIESLCQMTAEPLLTH